MSDDNYEISAKISGDSSGFTGALETAMKGLESWGINTEKMTEEGGALFKKFGVDVDAFADKFGFSSKLLVGVAAAGLAIGEFGKEVFEVGMKFDESFSLIGKATGAVGPQLRELGDEFTSVMGAGIVQNIDDVAQAFALLSQRLGVTGEELKKLTVEFSAFADVNRTSVTESVKLVTDVMNQWNITTEDSILLMDQLTKASQLTGRPVTELSQAILNSSAQFKQLGLSLTDSLGFMTAFSKAGADVSTTTMALNHAVVTLSQQTDDVAGAFKDYIAQIQQTKDPQEALTIATDLFGTRAAPRMADALRNAKFDLAGFTEQLEKAGGTLKRTNEGTESLGDKWAAFGKKAMAAVEPLGEVMVNIGKILVDVGNKIFEVLNNILSPILNLLKDEFRDFGDAIKAVFGAVTAAINGDWQSAWTYAQIVVLEVVKAVLDFFSAMANQIIGIINNMTSALRTALSAVGVDIKAMAAISLSEMSGVDAQIKRLNASIQTNSEQTTKVLGQQSAIRQKQINDEAKTYGKSYEEMVKAGLELQHADENLKEDQLEVAKYYNIASAAANQQALATQQLGATVDSVFSAMISGPFQALGAALVNGENLWQALGRAAIHSLGSVVKGLGDQMAAKAALDLAQAVAYSTNPFTAAAAPGFYAQAAVESAGATGAYVAAGALSAFELGTPYAPGGYALVGERGPEIVKLSQGDKVTPARETVATLKQSKGTTIHFNISEVRQDSVGPMMRKAHAMARQLAFEGVI